MTCDGKTLSLDEREFKSTVRDTPCGATVFGEDVAWWWLAIDGGPYPVFTNSARGRTVFPA